MPSLSTAVITGIVVVAILATRYVTLNISASVPVGLYRRAAVPQPLVRGDLVILSMPRRVGLFHSIWLPLLKPVAAVAGETACNLDDVLWIADRSYGPIFHEALGKPLPYLDGCVTVPDGYVFVASPVMKSLDSRYLGAIPIMGLSSGAVPLFTWR